MEIGQDRRRRKEEEEWADSLVHHPTPPLLYHHSTFHQATERNEGAKSLPSSFLSLLALIIKREEEGSAGRRGYEGEDSNKSDITGGRREEKPVLNADEVRAAEKKTERLWHLMFRLRVVVVVQGWSIGF